MVVHELLTELKSKGIVISLNKNGDLSVTAPKGAMTAELAQKIKSNKQDIVDFLDTGATSDAPSTLPIKQVLRDEPLPPSLAQERLWQVEQLFPGIPIYNLPHVFRLSGALDTATFEASLKWVVTRHEALRTRFEVVDEQPQTIIMEDVAVTLPIVRLDHIDGTEQEVMLGKMVNEQCQEPFDLLTGPLFRAMLYKLAPEEYVFLFLVHHIIFDGWSSEVFLDDLSFAYRTPEPDVARPPLSVQYVDFSVWQRDWLNSPVAEKEKSFWQSTLQAPVEALQLPVSRNSNNSLSFYQTQQQKMSIPRELTAQIKAMAQQTKATPFMVLLAAYKATLHAYTGQDDMIVCSPTAGRTVPVLDGLIGYFNNVVVFRSNLAEDPTFTELVNREKQAVLSANEHQAIPFQYLSELPSVNNSPLMRAMFVLQNSVKPLPNFPDLTISAFSMQDEDDYGYVDMAIELVEKDAEFVGNLWFKTALLDAADIEQFVENYLTLLTIVTEGPERPLSSLPQFDMPVVVDDDHVNVSEVIEKLPFTPPRDDLETELAAIWGKLLTYEPVSVYDDFFAVGGHSLLAIRLFEQIESTTGRKLPLSLLFQASNIAKLAEFIRDDSSEVSVSSIVTLSGHDTDLNSSDKQPFYCVTPPGDELLAFNGLAQAMGGERPFIGLQYGVHGEPPIMTIEEMSAFFVEQILSQDTNEPYLLGGYCFGGLLAYEMAQQLNAQGKDVALVAMIDSSVPGAVTEQESSPSNTINNKITIFKEEGGVALLQHILGQISYRWNLNIWHPFWARMQKRYEKQNKPLPKALRNFDFINSVAEERYQVQPYAGNVILIQAEEPYPTFIYPPYLGWDKYVTGELTDITVPGEHRTILDDPFVIDLADHLQQAIDHVLVKRNASNQALS